MPEVVISKNVSHFKSARKKAKVKKIVLFIVLCLIAALTLMPIVLVVLNSLKESSGIQIFEFPNSNNFVGIRNYIDGINYGDYNFFKAFFYTVLITVLSTVLILLCTSMAAWYIARTGSLVSKIVYYLCIFSMVVPFQMLMATLPAIADKLQLTTPYTIPFVYLGFGAGLAVFMFSGFVKSIPMEIEEAAAIDGCNPFQTFFRIVLPICKPMYMSVAVLEVMWIWNDYLLPYMIFLGSDYKTVPIQLAYLQTSHGNTPLGILMALVVFTIIPVIIFYFACQKYIVKGVMAGAVK